MINKKSKQTLILTVSFLGVSFLLFFLVIYPLLKGINEDSKSLVSAKSEISSLGSQIENLEEFKNFYQKNSADLEKINQLFIDPKIPITFVNFLENAAKNSQLSIKISLSQAGKIKTDAWPSIQFQISISGYSNNLLKFVEKLETAPYLIEIKNIAIEKSSEPRATSTEAAKNISTLVRASISIKVYTK